MFYKGTIEEFTPWEEAACIAEGIPNKDTTNYSEAILHPTLADNYIWKFGKYDTLMLPKITYEEALSQGYFPEWNS